jgi:membrane-associated phospholipid phosphatase
MSALVGTATALWGASGVSISILVAADGGGYRASMWGVHYPSDVVAGWLLGWLYGWGGVRLALWAWSRRRLRAH